MASEELGQKFFSRERIRSRLLKRAAEIWGFSESEMDDFDPLVSLLMDACSVEFEKVAGEIGKTQNRMLERLAHLLHPALISVRPSYGVVQCRSVEPESMLYSYGQFMYKSGANDRKKESQPIDLFFSPAFPFKIINGSIKYIATSRELFQLEQGIQKLPIASSRQKLLDTQHSLWLGIEIDDQLDSLDGVSFFFNWTNQPETDLLFQYLQYTQWKIDDKPVQVRPGLPSDPKSEEPVIRLEEEFDAMQKIEREVFDFFNRNYITVSAPDKLTQMKVNRKIYPSAFDRLFDKTELQELKEPLLWIEIRFPSAMPGEALDNIMCGINCVPILNRKLNRIPYKLLQTLNILPLETDGAFLSIKEIVNNQGKQVKLIPFANPTTMQAETFTLRYGVNRFDERNSYEILVNMLELIKEESSYFSSVGEEFLVQNIRELNTLLARLEEKIKVRNKHQSPYPYLIIRPEREGSNVLIEFWSCNGDLANKVPMGAELLPYRSNYVRSNHLFFMTSTFGGKDKLSDTEKIDQYKKSLLSRNRIVTLEDLKAAVHAELGRMASSVEYKKKYKPGSRTGEGFIMYMHIIITPKQNSLNDQEWEYRLRELRLKLEKQSANNIPYHLSLSDSIN